MNNRQNVTEGQLQGRLYEQRINILTKFLDRLDYIKLHSTIIDKGYCDKLKIHGNTPNEKPDIRYITMATIDKKATQLIYDNISTDERRTLIDFVNKIKEYIRKREEKGILPADIEDTTVFGNYMSDIVSSEWLEYLDSITQKVTNVPTGDLITILTKQLPSKIGGFLVTDSIKEIINQSEQPFISKLRESIRLSNPSIGRLPTPRHSLVQPGRPGRNLPGGKRKSIKRATKRLRRRRRATPRTTRR
jgi:hypothetical protein